LEAKGLFFGNSHIILRVGQVKRIAAI
jgi:hypothetical protein